MKRPSKELQDEWRKKLKDSGFHDIEDPTTGKLLGDQACPKPIHSKLDKGSGYVTRIQRYNLLEPYYRLARLFLNHHPFQSPLEKTIWRLHAEESMGKLRISRQLKIGESQVRRIMQDLKKKLLNFNPDDIKDPDET